MTDVDRRSAGRLMASTALFKNLVFIKFFGFSFLFLFFNFSKTIFL